MGRSRITDTTGHLWVEEGERREGTIAEVAPVIPTSRTYSFTVPEALESSLTLGQRVMVPLGRRARLVQGFVVGVDRQTWDGTLRPIHSLVDDASFLTPHLIDLGREMSEHYACPLGQTLKAITPEAVRRQRGLKTVRYVRAVRTLEDLSETDRRISQKRRAVFDALKASPDPLPEELLLSKVDISRATLRLMAKQGDVEILKRKEVGEATASDEPLIEPSYELNAEQRAALERVNAEIDAGRFFVTLLFGVSGSGKTEVYIHAIRRVIAAGRQAILLVPEIVLTTQLIQRLASRFANVAVNHSGLTDAQRSVIWREVAAGTRDVVIGTRSAVFAPCPNLGIICVDEEQETSFKNLQAPRFNVRDVAIMRAKQLNIPVVLGSATPSVETWYHSEHRADYQRVMIRNRVRQLPMPKVYVVDMHDEAAEQKKSVVLSRLMKRLLAETLLSGEQALLLINRRGFARRIYCPACRTRLSCPNCNVSLVVHTAIGRSICHYCRTRIVTPTVCPNVTCGEKLEQVGLGTQRVEDILAEAFPDARIQRVDSDTMRHRDEYRSMVDNFEARKIDILVGTQMIAKGLDFPFVSFVGVLEADGGTLATDFRVHERLFHLITQVAGRAGRADTCGRVVVQTTAPELPALQHALNHDYETFVAQELQARKRAGLPPFRRLARIVVADTREEKARHEAEALSERIRETISVLSLEYADVLGPNPCVLSRLRGKYRYDLLPRTLNASAMRRLMHELDQSGALRTKAQSTIIDVDPVAMM